jgi:hypothetical protein
LDQAENRLKTTFLYLQSFAVLTIISQQHHVREVTKLGLLKDRFYLRYWWKTLNTEVLTEVKEM